MNSKKHPSLKRFPKKNEEEAERITKNLLWYLREIRAQVEKIRVDLIRKQLRKE